MMTAKPVENFMNSTTYGSARRVRIREAVGIPVMVSFYTYRLEDCSEETACSKTGSVPIIEGSSACSCEKTLSAPT